MFLQREQVWLTAEELLLLFEALGWYETTAEGEIDGLDQLRDKLRVVYKALSKQESQE